MSQQDALKSQSVLADRPNRGLPYDKLILIKTMDASVTSTPPLRRYQMILQAALPFRDDIKKADVELFEYLRPLSSIVYSFFIARENGEQNKVSVVWDLRKTDYAKFVAPWASEVDITWIADMQDEEEANFTRFEDRWTQEQRFFITSRAYSIRTFDALKLSY